MFGWQSCLLVCLFASGGASAQKSTQDQAIVNCLKIIRECQLADGAFRIKANGDPVWIRPYFGNHAALALLAGKSPEDLLRVRKWIEWYSEAQLQDGSINDFEGRISTGYRDNGKRDSVDSYAATYLLTLARYQQEAKSLPDKAAQAARKALVAIQGSMDKDGLTWAKPDYKVKYLMDNVEVYGGLTAAERLFTAIDDKVSAATAKRLRESLGKKLPQYWRKDDQLFAYALLENGKYVVRPEVEAQRREAEGLANLFALAWISAAEKAPWKHALKEFQPDGGDAPQAPVERWFIAAINVAEAAEVEKWHQRTVAEAMKFTPDNVYIHRPAVVVLSLLEGRSWMPDVIKPRE